MISEKVDGLSFSIAFDGVYAPNFSVSQLFANTSLNEFFHCLETVRICSGYDSIPDATATGWYCRKVPFSQADQIVLRKKYDECKIEPVRNSQKQRSFISRFFNDICLVGYFGETPTCKECCAAHVKCMDNFECRTRRKEDADEIVLSEHAPLSKCSTRRLALTVTSLRKKYTL